MGSWVTLAIIVGCVAFAFPYVVGPILVLATLKFRVPAEILRVDPQQAALPNDVRQAMHVDYEQLTACGFEMRDLLYFPVIVPNLRTLVACYTNKTTQDGAISAFILGESEFTTLRKHHVEFVRRTADDTIIQTNNSDELGSFPRKPKEYTTQFFGERDVRQLFALHQHIARQLASNSPAVSRLETEFRGDCAAYFSQVVFGESLREQFQTGYLRDAGVEIRPTLKGAVLMAWKELWPVKSLRRSAARRTAERRRTGFQPVMHAQ